MKQLDKAGSRSSSCDDTALCAAGRLHVCWSFPFLVDPQVMTWWPLTSEAAKMKSWHSSSCHKKGNQSATETQVLKENKEIAAHRFWLEYSNLSSMMTVTTTMMEAIVLRIITRVMARVEWHRITIVRTCTSSRQNRIHKYRHIC